MFEDLQAEYERLREQLAHLQEERARLDAQHPPTDEAQRAYAERLRTFHREVVMYVRRVEDAASKHGGNT